MQVSKWGSSGHGWSALHPLIMDDIILPRSYAPEILSAGAAKQASFGQKLARDATQSKVRSLVCQPIITGNSGSIVGNRKGADTSEAWREVWLPEHLRDSNFASFRAIPRRESLKAEVPVMAQARWLAAIANTGELLPIARVEQHAN